MKRPLFLSSYLSYCIYIDRYSVLIDCIIPIIRFDQYRLSVLTMVGNVGEYDLNTKNSFFFFNLTCDINYWCCAHHSDDCWTVNQGITNADTTAYKTEWFYFLPWSRGTTRTILPRKMGSNVNLPLSIRAKLVTLFRMCPSSATVYECVCFYI